MKIAVIVNPLKPNSEETSIKIQNELAKYESVDFFVTSGTDFDSSPDMFFVVGGDGTLLNVLPKALKFDVPIICFNTGNVGFLAEVGSFEEIEPAIKRIMTKDFALEERNVLEVTHEDEVFYALNDACILKDGTSNVIKATVKSNQNTVLSFACDGVLVSTPTGSTAYSLSCGGPILSPNVKAMLLTPISAHVLFSRPMIFDGSEVVEISGKTPKTAQIVVDGRAVVCFEGEDSFSAKLSDKTVKFIKLNDESFFTKLQKKLKQWTAENNE